MARQNSRYFTPVIKKLLDARQKEVIVVDDAFKVRLRAQLMSRAFSNLKKEEKSGMDMSGLGEFFRKWKYQLALVPTVLVLALVAVQAFKMPVSVPGSGTVVPTTGGGAVTTEDVAETSKIKTFAGKNVLPPDYFEKRNAQPMAINFEMGEEVAGAGAGPDGNAAGYAVSNGNVAHNGDAGVIADAGAVKATGAEPVADEGDRGAVVIASTQGVTQGQVVTQQPAKTIQQYTRNVTAVQPQAVQAPTPAESTNDLLIPSLTEQAPDTNMLSVQATAMTVQLAAVQPAAVQPAAAETKATVQPASAITTAGVATKAGAPIKVDVPAAGTSAAQRPATPSVEGIALITPKTIHFDKTPAVKESVIINYNYSLTDADKEELEDKVIAGLIKDKSVLIVNVDKAALDVVKIEIVYNDTKSEEFLYKKNSKTGAWEHVKYATKYFYDDSLEYVKMNLLTPTYYPYNSPLLYPYDNY